MEGRKQKKKQTPNCAIKKPPVSSNPNAHARNLKKTDLGAVIFGCTNDTINECLSKQLFGLPKAHYSYIKNISEGFVLFLFNYSDRKLHGIFEAAGPGQKNIVSNAWVANGDKMECTRYPAQVRIRVKKECQPLSEKHFEPIIADNYYESKHFYFELDHDQTKELVKLFKQLPLHVTPKRQEYRAIQNLQAKDKVENGQTSYSSGQPLDVNQDCQLSSCVETNESDEMGNDEEDDCVAVNTVAKTPTDLHSLVEKLIEDVKALKGSQMRQIVKINMLEGELVASQQENQQLRNRIDLLESGSRS